MLRPLDLVTAALLWSGLTAIVSALVSLKLNRLFSTGMSHWALICVTAILVYALSKGLVLLYAPADAVADLGIIVAGLAAYAASRWLKGQFELVGSHDD